MSVTLGEILKWDILEKAKVATNSFDPATVVENITIMEAPDIGRWIDGNNIVLTSLYSVYEDKRKTAAFIDSLRQGRICAVFIKVHRFVDEVPQAILDACQELGIAVVEIPGSIRYIDIMYPVIAAIFDSRIVRLNHYRQTLNALTGQALGNKGLSSIARAFAEIVKNPVTLYDTDMKCIYTTCDSCTQIRDRTLLKEGVIEDLDYTIYDTVFEGEEKAQRQIVVPIRVFGQSKAFLSVVTKHHRMTELDFVALENAVTVLSLELVKEFAEEEIEGRFKQELVEDIRQNRNLDSVKDRLASINISTDAKYNVVLIEMPGDSIRRTPAIVKQQLVQQNEAKVFDLFLTAKKSVSLYGFESLNGNTITAFLKQGDASSQSNEKSLEKMLDNFLERVEKALPDFPLYIGYTSVFQDVTRAPELYKSARRALNICRMLYKQNSYCNYEKLGIFKILCLAKDRSELEEFVPRTIKILEQYQKESGLPLVETMKCYFKNNCNVQQTAKDMFVHYKTLGYRLNKIQDITGIDLKNSNEVLEMQMGLSILHVMETENEFWVDS